MAFKLGDQPGDNLRPQGTSFFGLGGGPASVPPALLNDPKVVDLRNLQTAVVLLRSASQLPGGDADLTVSEALNAANGDTSILGTPPADAAIPIVSENGLLAFQQANIEFANARDWLLQRTRLFGEAQRRREMAIAMVAAVKADLEQAIARNLDQTAVTEKKRQLAVAFATEKAEAEALERARRKLEESQQDTLKTRTETVKVLQSLAARVEPPAPPAAQARWPQFQRQMLEARIELEREQARLLREVDAMKIPPPQTYTRVHEGVILGAFTDADEARRLASTGRSPFTGKLYSEMAGEGGPGKGVVVVSFGTPGQARSSANHAREFARFTADHFALGEVSLQTPQAQSAMAALTGKEFDRLILHSNGASVGEALLNHGLIRVKELHIMGGDRSMANAPALQALLDSGAVKRIVVWRTSKDPVPYVSSPDQLLKIGQWSEDFAVRTVRKLTGNLAAGDARVEHPDPLTPPGASTDLTQGYFDLRHHYLEQSYYPAVAKKLGVPWPGRD